MTPELVEKISAEKSPPRVGLRGVFLGELNRAYVNVVASPAASYLLPDLLPAIEDMSFGTVKTREPHGILITDDFVTIGLMLREDLPRPSLWSQSVQKFDRMGAPGAGDATATTFDAPAIVAPILTGSLAPTAAVVIEQTQDAEEVPRLPPDSPMQAMASRIRELSGLSDGRLADLFKVRRETFNRWRSGAMTNPTEGARRRVGMVLHLLEELAARGVSINDWLQNPSAVDGITPYDLLFKGRIDEVAHLAVAVGEEFLPVRADIDQEPLEFEDDDEGWETVDIEVSDDER